ncbi:MAG TPA: hypothetical protein PKY27_03500 [Arachnia sp.]|jgi:hypothetical protein|nr:hypothetical protein [Arachnia sp.]HQD21299.1 hypothetical protein [Arachnia sp.]
MGNRTVEQIRADLAANRAKLVDVTTETVEALKPQNIARESVSQAKQFARTEFDNATSQFRDETGGWRRDKLLLIGGAVLGAVVFAVVLSRVSNQRQLNTAARKALEASRA